MGIAMSGMHYTGMAAATLRAGPVCGAASGIEPESLAVMMVPAALVILVVALPAFHLIARAKFLADSVARLDDHVDRMHGITREVRTSCAVQTGWYRRTCEKRQREHHNRRNCRGSDCARHGDLCKCANQWRHAERCIRAKPIHRGVAGSQQTR
nr:MHYT domain-containing protein [Paraburkholderia sp. UYCP14C]